MFIAFTQCRFVGNRTEKPSVFIMSNLISARITAPPLIHEFRLGHRRQKVNSAFITHKTLAEYENEVYHPRTRV